MQANRVNQSSTGLLRMTDDDRPFSKDLENLFSTLIVSLMPLTAHRVWFTKVDYTFLSEDAILNLGSLKFSQSNRMPHPKDPSRIITTTATATFSMSQDMGRSLCQLFLDAQYIESADGKHEPEYDMRGTVWQLTLKGIVVLDQFCSKNGLQPKQLVELTNLSSIHLITLERDGKTDKLFQDQSIIQVIFLRFVEAMGRGNQAPGTNESTLSGDYKRSTRVKMVAERRVNGVLYRDAFTGKACVDWIMENSTTIDIQEAIEIASHFVQHDLIEQVLHDRNVSSLYSDCKLFQPSKNALYRLSRQGKALLNKTTLSRGPSQNKGESAPRFGTKHSNTHRLDKILADPTLRLLFRENLREMHCEENLSFYQEVDEFIRECKAATRNLQESTDSASEDRAKELFAVSYGIYNAFLAPNSPREINIHHQLRASLASRMTEATGQDNSVADTLRKVTSLFEDAQSAVFKLMTSDSVQKFFQNPKYASQLANSGLL